MIIKGIEVKVIKEEEVAMVIEEAVVPEVEEGLTIDQLVRSVKELVIWKLHAILDLIVITSHMFQRLINNNTSMHLGVLQAITMEI